MEPSLNSNDPSYKKHLISRVLVFLIISFSLASFALLFLFTRGRATEYQKHSNGNGLWSHAETWTPVGVPKAGDNVEIKKDHVVTYDQDSNEVIGEVSIKGQLKFANDKNTKLVTKENILVEEGGKLEVGNAGAPIHSDVKAQVIWRISQATADSYTGGFCYNQGDKGLWVGPPYDCNSAAHSGNPATFDVYGSPIKRTWAKLAADAPSGSNKVVVDKDVTDWYVGGEVAIPSTVRLDLQEDSNVKGQPKKISQNEINKIKSISKVGENTEITLEKPLTYSHSGTDPYRGEVALLTRNVLFKTEIEGADEGKYLTDVTSRKFAHIHEHHSMGSIQYAELKYMGHYATLSRYALHSHLVGEHGAHQIYRGNSFAYTGFRCVNLHGAQGVLVEDNVCYDSVTTGYFVEQQGEPNYDYRFVHNFVAGIRNIEDAEFDPKDPEGNIVSQELRQASGFWAGVSENAAFLGNVASSQIDGGLKSAGYNLTSDGATDEGGTMPFVFVGNEVHGMKHGVWSWQNAAKARDLVGTKIWRNGEFGIRWGAYGTPNKYFNTEIRDNASSALAVLSVHSFIQDSLIEGRAEGDSVNGFEFDAYIQPQPLKYGNWIARNTFRKFDNGVTEKHATCDDQDAAKKILIRGRCSAIYSIMMSNTFEDVDKPYDFGLQANFNNMWKVYDYKGDSFVILRDNQLSSSNQTDLTRRLVVPGKTALNSEFGGLVTRLADLPSTIDYGSTLVDEDGKPMPYVFKTEKDLPPVVKNLRVTMNGKTATIDVDVTDDKKVTKVEFMANWESIGEVTVAKSGSTYELVKNLDEVGKDWPKDKFIYLYARAYDDVKLEAEKPANNHLQRAYSNIIEIGPEVLGLGDSMPDKHDHGTPTVTTGPTTAPTKTPTPTSPPPAQPHPTIVVPSVSNSNDQTAPILLVLRPKTSEIISGRAKFSVRAVDNKGIARVEFYVDGKYIGNGSKELNRYVINWPSQSVSNGTHKLTVRGYDTSGNTTSVNVNFVVQN